MMGRTSVGTATRARSIVDALRKEIRELQLEVLALKRKLVHSTALPGHRQGRTGTNWPRSRAVRARFKQLPPRLRETFRYLLTGKTEREIAAKMSLSPYTIHDYVKAVYAKFGVQSRTSLIAFAAQPAVNLPPPPPPSQITVPRISRTARRFTDEFRKLPPGLSYAQIAQRLDVEYGVARAWAKRLNYPVRLLPRGRPSIYQRHLKQLGRFPHSLTIVDVAQRLKLPPTVAHRLIRAAGYPFRRASGSGEGNRKAYASRWAKVDWTMSNIQIAETIGVSRERVRQVREQRGAKPPTLKNLRR
jgi:DNA-binding CsgD family transcriptional regulator